MLLAVAVAVGVWIFGTSPALLSACLAAFVVSARRTMSGAAWARLFLGGALLFPGMTYGQTSPPEGNPPGDGDSHEEFVFQKTENISEFYRLLKSVINTNDQANEFELWVGSKPVASGETLDQLPLLSLPKDTLVGVLSRDENGLPLQVGLTRLQQADNRLTAGTKLSLDRIGKNWSLNLDGFSTNIGMVIESSEDLANWKSLVGVPVKSQQTELPVPTNGTPVFFRTRILPPEKPVGLTVQAGDRQLKIAWAGRASTFRVYYGSNSFDEASLNLPSAGVSSLVEISSPSVITGLVNGAAYHVRVQSENGITNSPLSEQVVGIPGSTNVSAKKRLLIFGSSVALGVGDPTGKGWAGRLADAIKPDWQVVNRSISGNNTTDLLRRFDRDVASERWDAVWIGMSLWNEGIWGSDPGEVHANYVKNIRQLIAQIRQEGAVPILSGTYPNNHYSEREYSYCRRFNDELNRWGVAGVDFMSAVDNGSGKWMSGYFSDALHPNALGHEAMFNEIPLDMFSPLLASRPRRTAPTNSIRLGNDTVNASPLRFVPSSPVKGFTVSFWFRGSNISGKSLCGIGSTESRIRSLDGSLRYTSANGAEAVAWGVNPNDGAWHHCALVHFSARRLTRFYVDGRLIGAVNERFDPVDSFSLGGRESAPWANAVGTSFSQWVIYRASLNDSQVALMANRMPVKLSVELWARLDDVALMPDTEIRNSAPSSRKAVSNSPFWQPVPGAP
jgi:lysophospholipase L1-like esterase